MKGYFYYFDVLAIISLAADNHHQSIVRPLKEKKKICIGLICNINYCFL